MWTAEGSGQVKRPKRQDKRSPECSPTPTELHDMASRISKPRIEKPSPLKGESRVDIQRLAQVAAANKLNDARRKEQAARTTCEVVLRSC